MSMKLSFHGGNCCGIKVIHGFMWGGPADYEEKLKDVPQPPDEGEQYIDPEYTRFYWKSRPVETGLTRFKVYLEYCKKHRPNGIVEVVFADFQIEDTKWEQVLYDHGFKKVNSCLNSNSGNRIHIYHLNMGE